MSPNVIYIVHTHHVNHQIIYWNRLLIELEVMLVSFYIHDHQHNPEPIASIIISN
jgi:hypothetical protein